MNHHESGNESRAGWRDHLADRLPSLGHRNWICVVDAAYPEQTAAGIEMVPTGCDHIKVVNAVLEAVGFAQHIRAIVYLDSELKYLEENAAPGIDALRTQLDVSLEDAEVVSMPHEDIIRMLDQAGQEFHVLILKSNLTLPYTSLFLQLECGYWDEKSEKALRQIINSRYADPVEEGK